MELTLLLLVTAVGLCAILCVYVPIRLLLIRGAHVPAVGRYALFFAAIGLGYFLVEITLLQKFGLFLGHPNFALSVVLASLLLSSGAGSLFSTRILKVFRQQRFVSFALCALLLCESLLIFPVLPRL